MKISVPFPLSPFPSFHARVGIELRNRAGEQTMIKLAKFKPAKRPENREVGQLCQHFFEDCVDRFVPVFVGLEDSTHPTKTEDGPGWNLALPRYGGNG